MILKGQEPTATPASGAAQRRRSRSREPLDVELSVVLRFGDGPADRVTLINQRRVPMVGSLIDNRDRILRGFVGLMLRAAAAQPRLARQLLPRKRRKAAP